MSGSDAQQVLEALSGNTMFMYRYRDAANHKNSCAVVFRGRPCGGDAAGLARLARHADEGVYFIPEQVGLHGLQGSWAGRYSEDDHAWHELVHLSETDSAATDPRHINEFLDEFAIQQWDIEFCAIADELKAFDAANNDGAWAIDA